MDVYTMFHYYTIQRDADPHTLVWLQISRSKIDSTRCRKGIQLQGRKNIEGSEFIAGRQQPPILRQSCHAYELYQNHVP